jgi:2-octaprenyl-6-methoxyphenol hydroxylase
MRRKADIAIVGAGQVGLSLAVALRQAAPTLAVTLLDAHPVERLAGDPRASAIAAAARRMFETLGVWQAVASRASPIRDMIVTDSALAAAVRPTYLSFSGEVAEGEPFAHMVENADLARALLARARDLGVTIEAPAAVTGLDLTAAPRLTLADGDELAARLIVAADGVRSRLRDLAGLKTVAIDYDQAGIVLTVAHEREHGGRAEEHFLPAGPFAILPLCDDAEGRHRSSLVWTESRDQARQLVEGDDFTFQLELERRFGRHLGSIAPLGPRKAFPLGLSLARDWVKPGFALVGDAAHFIHPIAGQGLNLGLKDVAALAEVVVEAVRVGLEPGRPEILERYQAWRRFDTVEMGVATDLLDRLFSNDVGPLRALRATGLALVDRMPALKSRFIRTASGLEGDMPRLLTGGTL